MQTRSPDTDLEAEKVQLDLLREAGPARRVQMALRLSQTVIALARRAIQRGHPEASEEEVGLLFVERHYGRELALELRHYLANRRP